MSIKFVKGDFFAPENAAAHRAFGFTGSATNARSHAADPAGEEDNGTYVERRAKGGRIGKPSPAHANDPQGYALGGMVDGAPSGMPQGSGPAQPPQAMGALQNATISMPAHDAATVIANVARAGKMIGAHQALSGLAQAARTRLGNPVGAPGAAHAMAAAPPPAPAHQEIPAMKDGGEVRHKGFHPGGEKGKLHRELGVPEDQKIPSSRLESAAHSRNPEVRRDAIRAKTMKSWNHGRH